VTEPTPDEIAAAKALLAGAGFVVLREKSYRQAQERQRVAECQRESAEDRVRSVETWARGCHAEERRLARRLTFVYGLAQAHGATAEELRGDTIDELDAVAEAAKSYRLAVERGISTSDEWFVLTDRLDAVARTEANRKAVLS
jgi:hypothetical protein